MQFSGVEDVCREGIWLKSYGLDGDQYHTRSGVLWKAMNTRCGNTNNYKNRSYANSRNLFTSFQDFSQWCQGQYGYMNRELNGRYWSLDKDFIVPGNRDYHNNTCCFLPQELNAVFSDVASSRGSYPIGVSYNSKRQKLVAQISIECKVVNLGQYTVPADAHKAWQIAKVERLTNLLEKYSYLPLNVLTGMSQHTNMIISDIENNRETIKGFKYV